MNTNKNIKQLQCLCVLREGCWALQIEKYFLPISFTFAGVSLLIYSTCVCVASLLRCNSSQCVCLHCTRVRRISDPSKLCRSRKYARLLFLLDAGAQCGNSTGHAGQDVGHRNKTKRPVYFQKKKNISLLHMKQQRYRPLSKEIQSYQKHVKLITI